MNDATQTHTHATHADMGRPHGREALTQPRPERPKVSVGDIFRRHGERYRAEHHLSRDQERALRALALCRTKDLGGHKEVCDHCGHVRIAYNSCRNRHCATCQYGKREEWIQARHADMLPVAHSHIVFTLPQEINELVRYNQKALYTLLFRAASDTLLTLCRDEKYLGATPGMLAVLHTWGQTLTFHPHLHVLITAGGLADHSAPVWKKSRDNYFLPVKVVARLFRGKYLAGVKRLYERGELILPYLAADAISGVRRLCFAQMLSLLYAKDWIVYAKKPMGEIRHVVDYLGRYTHRVAIANGRLLSADDAVVRFRYKDYRDRNRHKVMQLTPIEFIRRFLRHILPARFVKIRFYGQYGCRGKKTRHALCLELLKSDTDAKTTCVTSVMPPDAKPDARKPESGDGIAPVGETWQQRLLRLTGLDVNLCQKCRMGRMLIVERYLPVRSRGP